MCLWCAGKVSDYFSKSCGMSSFPHICIFYVPIKSIYYEIRRAITLIELDPSPYFSIINVHLVDIKVFAKFDEISIQRVYILSKNNAISENTVMFLSFQTDRSWQTVQTQIRLLEEQSDQGLHSLIRVYTVCHSICIVWTHYSMVEPHGSNFRVISTNFWGVQIFRKFTVHLQLSKNDKCCECHQRDNIM